MANKTFIPEVTGKKNTDLAGSLQEEYKKLDLKVFSNKQYTINKDTKFVLERERYAEGDKKGKIDSKLIPLIEINNKMHEGSPILFVGMNPSGTDIKHYKSSPPHDVFIYDGNSPYYSQMRQFAFDCLKGIESKIQKLEDAEGSYSELDLFGVVQSTQGIIQMDLLAEPDKYGKLFDLFLKYVQKINPRVIIVANAFVRKILLHAAHAPEEREDLKFQKSEDEFYFYGSPASPKFTLKKNPDFGGYTFINSMWNSESQLYFSSMLSGQRALDKGSRDNLVWLVRNFLSK